MVREDDQAESSRKLDAELSQEPKGRAPGLPAADLAAGCRHLREQGFSLAEIASVFDIEPAAVERILRPGRTKAVAILAFAALLCLAVLVWFFLSNTRESGLIVEVVPEAWRGPQVLRAGGSYSLRLRKLPSPACLLVVRVHGEEEAAIDFPMGPSQATHRFVEGELVPGTSAGGALELAAGPERGTFTLIVAAGRGPFWPLDQWRELVAAASSRTRLDSAATEHESRVTSLVVEALGQRGAQSIQVLKLEVME